MSKRLQVLLEETELEEIKRIARRHRMTVAEWVRQSLRASRANEPTTSVNSKLDALAQAAELSFPSPDIEQMLAEIASGYGDPPA